MWQGGKGREDGLHCPCPPAPPISSPPNLFLEDRQPPRFRPIFIGGPPVLHTYERASPMSTDDLGCLVTTFFTVLLVLAPSTKGWRGASAAKV